ncbi:MAG: hypothetical protein ACK46N_19440, partial [Dolichospermum sp.]
FNVKRESDTLVVINAEAIADLPKKRRPPFKAASRGVANSGTRKPFPPAAMVKPHVPLERPQVIPRSLRNLNPKKQLLSQIIVIIRPGNR